MDHEDRVVLPVGKGQMQRITMVKSNLLSQTDTLAERGRSHHELPGKIDARYMTAEFPRQGARRPAQPAAHIQNAHAGRQSGQLPQLHGCLAAHQMQFIKSAQIVGAQPARIVTGRLQLRQQPVGQMDAAVCGIHRCRVLTHVSCRLCRIIRCAAHRLCR